MKYYVLMLLAMLVTFLNDLNHDITWKNKKTLLNSMQLYIRQKACIKRERNTSSCTNKSCTLLCLYGVLDLVHGVLLQLTDKLLQHKFWRHTLYTHTHTHTHTHTPSLPCFWASQWWSAAVAQGRARSWGDRFCPSWRPQCCRGAADPAPGCPARRMCDSAHCRSDHLHRKWGPRGLGTPVGTKGYSCKSADTEEETERTSFISIQKRD